MAATGQLVDVPRPRTISAAVAGVAALILLALWQVPQWLDWTRYRATIEVLASASLGQPVTIQGPITLSLLPQPVLTAARVDVGGREPTSLSMHVEALRLRVALLPLIGGRVDARELVLRGPDLHIPWPSESGLLPLHPPPWIAALAARIENGRLTIGRVAFTDINASLGTLDTGAVSASGTAQFSGQDWHFTSRLTAAGADGAAGLDVTLDGRGKASGLGASFTGQVARDGTLSGAIASRGPNLAVLLPTPSVSFRADGRLTVGSGLAAIDDLALEIGGSPASGAVALRVAPNQRLDIAISASRLDFDAWLPVLVSASTTVAGIDIPIGIDFSVEAAPLGGGTLERIRAAFDLSGNDLAVREASALLPGNGRLQLSGHVARDDPEHPRFEGHARLDAPVLRATLRWLDDALPGSMPEGLGRLLASGITQRAALSARVLAARGEIALQGLAGTLDDIPISGSMSLKRGEPAAVTADLSLSRLALDPWLPTRLPNLADLPKSLAALDAEVKLNIREASVGGAMIDGLAVDAAIEAGSVMLRRAEGTVRGAHVLASGMLGEEGRLSAGKFSMTTKNAAPLADLFPPTWQATPALWQGPARLELQAAGPQDALAVDVTLAAADARMEVASTVDLPRAEWSGTLTLRHPGARRLLATLGLPERTHLEALASWLGDGSLSLVAHLAGAPRRLVAQSFELAAGSLRADGDLAIDRSGEDPRVSGHVRADALTVLAPNGASTVPLPLAALQGWRGDLQIAIDRLDVGGSPDIRDASATLILADGVLRLDQFSGVLGTGSVSGNLTFDTTADPPAMTVQAQLAGATITGPVADASLELLSGRADASLRLQANGYSPSAIVATLGGRATLTVTDGSLSGLDLFRLKLAVEKSDPKSIEAVAVDALSGGATGFERLDVVADVAHGDLTLDRAVLSAVTGETRASGNMNLASQSLDVRIAVQPAVPSPPELAVRLTGPIDHPKRSVELAGLARWMAELVR